VFIFVARDEKHRLKHQIYKQFQDALHVAAEVGNGFKVILQVCRQKPITQCIELGQNTA
jgi:hypothetical protein